jgi:hypothetical protein
MQVSTKPGKPDTLRMTVTEIKRLNNTVDLLGKISKHAEGVVSELATSAAAGIGALMLAIKPEEVLDGQKRLPGLEEDGQPADPTAPPASSDLGTGADAANTEAASDTTTPRTRKPRHDKQTAGADGTTG